jgi:hypothetical protein
MCEPSGASTAAIVSLNALGKQDRYLISENTNDSLFNYETKRHANFRKYHRVTNVSKMSNKDSWPFGEKVKVTFNPQNMGDLLSNMYVRIKLPSLQLGYNYADQIGRHIFKSIRMHVDELKVETLYDDWCIIYDELYSEITEKVANRYLLNRNLPFDSSDSYNVFAAFESEIVIPLHFFFSRKYASDEYSSNKPNRPFFPLCSIYKQKLEFEFDFHKQSFFTNTPDILGLLDFDIVTEEITLPPDERMYFMKEKQLLVTDTVFRHPSTTTELGKNIIKNNIVANVPVKCIHWFFRNEKFEDEDVSEGDPIPSEEGEYMIHNRFNFSSNVNFDQTFTFFAPVMYDAKFHINGNRLPNVTSTNHSFYKYLIPFQKRLSRPIRNIYTYSFSMNPMNVEPSGSLDFSNIQSDKTNIDIQLESNLTDTYTLHMYYTGYQTFMFENGFMKVAY